MKHRIVLFCNGSVIRLKINVVLEKRVTLPKKTITLIDLNKYPKEYYGMMTLLYNDFIICKSKCNLKICCSSQIRESLHKGERSVKQAEKILKNGYTFNLM